MLKLVPKLGADIGIAWDGDGDRVVCVDEKGNFVVGDKVFALCALSELQKEKGMFPQLSLRVGRSKK